MNCKKCGEPLTPDASFCVNCGEPVMAPVEETKTEVKKEEASVVNEEPKEPVVPPRKSQPTFFQKYDVFIVSAVVILISAILIGPMLFQNKKSTVTHLMDGYEFPIANRYTYEESDGDLQILNDKENALLQIRVMKDASFRDFKTGITENEEAFISTIKSSYSGTDVVGLKIQKIEKRDVITIQIKSEDNEEGIISYFETGDDVIIMAVYIQKDNLVDQKEFKRMMATIMETKKDA